MKLANPDLLIVEQEKITDYLLNAAHPDNGGKAQFFFSAGFSREGWQMLAAAFQQLAGTFLVTKKVESAHGIKYVVDGKMTTPSGKMCEVRTIWIIDKGEKMPRLVTAYPNEK